MKDLRLNVALRAKGFENNFDAYNKLGWMTPVLCERSITHVTMPRDISCCKRSNVIARSWIPAEL